MDVLSRRGIRFGGVDPRGRRPVWCAALHFNLQATKMTVVKTVSTAILEPSFLNRHFRDVDAGELPGELTLVYRDAAL
jgi:hypothetical protein